jgi:hypothetical protein
MPVVLVKKVDDKTFELSVNGRVIGISKADFDARFHAYFLEELFAKEYERGYADGATSTTLE